MKLITHLCLNVRAVISSFSISALSTYAFTTSTQAHDIWANGSSIPDWVKTSCCGPADAHHLTPEQVHHVEGGWRIDGYPDLIPEAQTLPSQDGDYWAFYSAYARQDGTTGYSRVYCFFVPLSL